MTDEVNLEVARAHGLSADEYQMILDKLGRTPNLVELGIISVMWSEHCSYKSSRTHLKKLPTTAPWVLLGPGENAGVIDLGDGLAACFKMESHNHPSYIEPFQGAATGVGGIMRDIFTMGARPIANMNSLRFGAPTSPRMRFLLGGVVAGIGGYGNCMGVPTVGGEIAFDNSYDGNILVNAFTLGIMPSDKIFLSAAAGVGNPVVYVGSKTGRDGIHGATMASEEFGKDSESKRPRVQVGDPFTEKKLLEACLELMQKDAVIAIQDMGAAGLTCSTCEMAAKGGLGIEIDVKKVPQRETGMTPYEIMLSESQERMLMVIEEGSREVVEAIFQKWDLDVAQVGTITDTGRVVITEGADVVCDIPVGVAVDDAPLYDRPYAAPHDLEARWEIPPLPDKDASQRLRALLAQPTVASKRWVYEQYDSTVRDSTVHGPGAADAAVVRLPTLDGLPDPKQRKGLAMTSDMNGRFVALDPRRGAALGVLEAARNLACVGAPARATTDCLNFGNPEKPEVMWSLVEAIEGLGEACTELKAPIISGNVSLYNETEGTPILPTPTIAMVGVVDDITRSPGSAFKDAGDRLFLLGGLEAASLAGSELLLMESGVLCGRPAAPNFVEAKAVNAACIALIQAGVVKSAHDVSEGGLAVCLAESCIQAESPVGASVQLPKGVDPVNALFGEGANLIVVSVSGADTSAVQQVAARCGAPVFEIGEVGGSQLVIDDAVAVPTAELADVWAMGLMRSFDEAPRQ